MRHLRAERGQATVDYVALLALLAVLLAAAAAGTAIGAPGVANAVLGQLRRALCLVSGGPCPLAASDPCTVASRRDARHVAVDLGIVRLDETRVVLRERLSDGTIRLTVSWRDGAGVEAAAGGEAKVDVRGHEIGFDREARAGAPGVLGHGEVYYARGERAADALLRELRRAPAGSDRPRASEVFTEGGVRGLARVDAGASHALGGRLGGLAEATLGVRHDRRSGELTVALTAGGGASGLVSIAVGGEAGDLDGDAVLGLTLDRGHRPVALTVSAAGTVAAGATMPSGIAQALERAADPVKQGSAGGRRWEFGARADLTDPGIARAWKAFRRSPASPVAIRALGEQLRDHARLDVRSYRLDNSSSRVGAEIALGLKLGGEYEHAIDRSRLLAAATRPPFGLWEARLDCLA
ncbi:MAG: hypothetical protein QOE11_1365 [Solirubrobacteraceae bacterium]|jgi:hypothetical protein|nr:hypothetical protein [Solirubrobacteraceae bacterium]